MQKQMYEAMIDEENFTSGIFAVSLVEQPAIESEWITLSKDEPILFKKVDEEKRIVMGAVLIPNKPIYRKEGETEFYLYFSKDTVRRASELFMINGFQSNTTLEHQVPVKGLTMVESWIVESAEHDKSKAFDLSVPVGTWMASIKVENDDVWNDFVKTGEVRGFSIEGYFKPELREELSKKSLTDEEKVERIRELLNLS